MEKTLLPSNIKKLKHKPPINSTVIIRLLEKSDCCLRNASQDQSYTLTELHNWVKPLSMVNKRVYSLAQNTKFLRGIVSSVAHSNDHYNEGDIAQALNTPGARRYIRLCSQLFNTHLTHDTVYFLIKKEGADINYRAPYHTGGDTPLIYAIRRQSLKYTRILLQNDARLDHYAGIDPISLSITIGNGTIFKLLMLYYNPDKGNLDLPLRQAIQQYATVDTQEANIQKKYKKIIKILLNKNADATEGVIYAIEHGYLYPSLLYLLIYKYNADPNEAFKKLTEYVLNNSNAQQSHVKSALRVIAQSSAFKKEESEEVLSTYAKRINKLAAWIDAQPR